MIFAQSSKEVLSDQVITGTTVVVITELACEVNPGARAHFLFYILFQQSLLTDSIRLDLNFPTSPVSIVYNITVPGIATTSNAPAIGTALTAANTSYLAKIEGYLANGPNAGLLQPKCASTGVASSITVKANSCAMTAAI